MNYLFPHLIYYIKFKIFKTITILMACCCGMFRLLLCMFGLAVKYIYPLTKSYEIITAKDDKKKRKPDFDPKV